MVTLASPLALVGQSHPWPPWPPWPRRTGRRVEVAGRWTLADPRIKLLSEPPLGEGEGPMLMSNESSCFISDVQFQGPLLLGFLSCNRKIV